MNDYLNDAIEKVIELYFENYLLKEAIKLVKEELRKENIKCE